MIRRLLATVGRITERLVPDHLMLGDRVASWPDALVAAEENVEVLELGQSPIEQVGKRIGDLLVIAMGRPSDFPDCNCPARICADLDDHWPTCKARVGDIPAAGERSPDQRPAAGSDFIIGANDLLIGASILRDYATRCTTTWPDHRRIRAVADRFQSNAEALIRATTP